MEKNFYPWFKREDIDGFFALFQNNLANFVLIAVSMTAMGFPASIVYGKVIPGVAMSVLFGNLYYAKLAEKLALKEKRKDVTALAYGVSTPVMFIYLFGVLRPALELTGDPELAWKIGLGACFIGGVIEVLGSFIGKFVHKHLPRAAMLGALAGVAFAFIGGEMFFMTYELPIAGMAVLVIMLIGFIAKKPLPFKIPAALFAIVIGTFLAYTVGGQDMSQVREGLGSFGFYLPMPTLGLFEGLVFMAREMAGLFAILLPISIYNFVETMNNVEAMASAGDRYDVAEAQLADGLGTLFGTFFGGVFPTTVYIASIGSKWMNAGRGYSILNGFVFLLASTFGVVAVMAKIIPMAVIAPILVFVGISMVTQAFGTVEKKHFPAVVIAMFPYFANYLMTRFNGGASEVVAKLSSGIVPLGQGAMFTGIVWGAILVFLIDGEYRKASVTSICAALLTATGFMHAPKLALFFDARFVTAYVLVALIFEGYRRYDAMLVHQSESIRKKADEVIPVDGLAASEQ